MSSSLSPSWITSEEKTRGSKNRDLLGRLYQKRTWRCPFDDRRSVAGSFCTTTHAENGSHNVYQASRSIRTPSIPLPISCALQGRPDTDIFQTASSLDSEGHVQTFSSSFTYTIPSTWPLARQPENREDIPPSYLDQSIYSYERRKIEPERTKYGYSIAIRLVHNGKLSH